MSGVPTPEELAALPHDDRGTTILVVHWTLTSFATIFLALRIYSKNLVGRKLWWDDHILIAAWCLIVITSALTTCLVTESGLGHHSYDLYISDLARYIIIISVRATMTITVTGWTKTSFGITLLRLTSGRTKAFVWFCILSINATTIVSAIIPWAQCVPLSKTWDPHMTGGECWAPRVGTKIWIGLGAWNAMMDFVLAALPWRILRDMQLRTKEKIGVTVALSMGVIAGATGIAKCVALPNLGAGDAYNEVELFLWDITEGTVTLMAACIPTLRVLVRETRTPTITSYKLSDFSFSFKTPLSNAGRRESRGATRLDDEQSVVHVLDEVEVHHTKN